MTPKDKAYELINNVSYQLDQLPYSFCKWVASLISDECIKVAPEEQREYWLSVKLEIEEA